VQINDLLAVFADKCRISYSEVFNKWKIVLDSENMEPFEANQKSQSIIERLEQIDLNEKTLKMLQAHIILNKQTILDLNSPASSRSGGSQGSYGSKDSKGSSLESFSQMAKLSAS